MIVDKFLSQLKDIDGKILVLCSGGLDSVATVKLLVKRYGPQKIEILNINHGQRQGKFEEFYSKKAAEVNGAAFYSIDVSNSFAAIYKGISCQVDHDIPFESKYVACPGKALILFGYASSFCFAKQINTLSTGICAYGNLREFPPTNFFLKKYQELVSADYLGETKISIINPLINISKEQIIQMIYELDGNLDYLKNSITCYNPTDNGKSCGVCGACTIRLRGFLKAGFKDPIEYTKYPSATEIMGRNIRPALH